MLSCHCEANDCLQHRVNWLATTILNLHEANTPRLLRHALGVVREITRHPRCAWLQFAFVTRTIAFVVGPGIIIGVFAGIVIAIACMAHIAGNTTESQGTNLRSNTLVCVGFPFWSAGFTTG